MKQNLTTQRYKTQHLDNNFHQLKMNLILNLKQFQISLKI
jgi:hypothetical protein